MKISGLKIREIICEILAVCFILSVAFYYFFYQTEVQIPQKKAEVAINQADTLIEEKCSGEDSNAGFNSCADSLFRRKAAEREWKQRKIETYNPKNKNNLMSFEDSQAKIALWREGFEKNRDTWCDAVSNTFFWGSGRIADEAGCRIAIELQAINDLDYVYNKINEQKSNDEEIVDFQPTEIEIEMLSN